jgi:hypothetical protein
MRPAGEVREALLDAVRTLATPTRGPTLTELARKACVSQQAARRTVDNLCRSGVLTIPRTRKVLYRNRPVAEYAPASPSDSPIVDLATLLAAWGRQG